jgi:photosystem II stability/assembly factor-like uncharacterized protein
MKNRILVGFLVLLHTSMLAQTPSAAQPSAETFKNLRYRFIGPDGNRAIAIAGEVGNPNVVYIGAASGGIFKTDDAGLSWKPIFDNQEVSSIGALAVSQSDPKQVWAGTGETFLIRPAHSLGNGIYKSSDAGKTWKNMGLEKTGRIGRVIVHPTNPDIVYACALGHVYGPQQERGVYRTKDGGNTWERLLFVNENTGAIDLSMDASNPDVLFAGMWQIGINTWGLRSGGPSGGIYRSKDGGNTWEPLNEKIFGKKDRPVGKVSVAVSPKNPKVVYALMELESPALYRSADGGETWTLQSNDHSMAERAPYYTRITLAPDNENELHTICVKHGTTKDAGKTWTWGYGSGGDNHDFWIDPLNPNRMMMAHDGCASISLNRGKSYQRVVLPIAQMYHVSVDNQIPYNVYGNRQDGYSYGGPSNSRAGGIPLSAWQGVGGCESGFAKPDPFDENIIISGCYDGGLEVYDKRTQHSRDVRVWPEAGYGHKPADMKLRWHWNFPLSWSPHTPHRVYVGSQYVHKSDDFGQSWQIISPDLTTNDKSHQQSSGGIATDNLMTYDGCTMFAIEESPIQKDMIWAGTNDGQVQLTRDGGKTWENLTANLNVPKWGTIANIEPSRYDAGTAYISVDLHQMADFEPYILKTEDFGKTWRKISDGIPKSILSFVHVVKEDPKLKGMLYAGTDNNLYCSLDDGKNWFSLRLNMPPAPVYWLEIQKGFDDLVVATYGRGFYILDDISAVRAMASLGGQSVSSVPSLLPVRPAYRFQNIGASHTERTLSDGQNPPYGAGINIFLKDTLAQSAKMTILKDGKPVRELNVSNKQGINRIYWDLRHEAPEKAILRTLPPDKPWVQFDKDSTRRLVTWDLDLMGGLLGPKAAPGKYTAKLITDKGEQTQDFEVRKDPYTKGTQADIEEQVAFSLQIRDALNQAVTMINELEKMRKKINGVPQLQNGFKKEKARATELWAFDQAATNLSAQLYDIHLTGAREDAFRNPMQVYERLLSLASDAGTNGSDFKPTNQQREVFAVLNERLQKAQQQFDTAIKPNWAKLNPTAAPVKKTGSLGGAK